MTNDQSIQYLIDQLGLQKIADQNNLVTVHELLNKARDIHKENLQHAFHAGWMRANALNYDPKYFDHYISEL